MEQKELLKVLFTKDGLTPAEIELVLESFHLVHFSKGEYLYPIDQVIDRYFYIANGFVRSFAQDYESNDTTTDFYGPADIVIDWSSFFLRQPVKEYFQATVDTKCWEISFADFQKLFNSIESFREAGRSHFAASYFQLKQKSLNIIMLQAKDRYLQLLENRPEVIQNASLKHIATYLGITDSSLSRIRREISQSTEK